MVPTNRFGNTAWITKSHILTGEQKSYPHADTNEKQRLRKKPADFQGYDRIRGKDEKQVLDKIHDCLKSLVCSSRQLFKGVEVKNG